MLLTFRVLVFLVIFETVQQRLEQSFIEHACDLYTPAVNTVSLLLLSLHFLSLLVVVGGGGGNTASGSSDGEEDDKDEELGEGSGKRNR